MPVQKELPVEGICQVKWINIEVVVGVFSGSEGIAAATVLSQELQLTVKTALSVALPNTLLIQC